MMNLLINVDVDDLSRALAFYTAAFDLQLRRELGDWALELSGAQVPLYLVAKPGGTFPFTNARSRRSYERHWTPVHFDMSVENLEVAVARAIAAGATTEGAVEDHAWGRIAYLADPFGHGFCLIQFSEQGYDAIAR